VQVEGHDGNGSLPWQGNWDMQAYADLADFGEADQCFHGATDRLLRTLPSERPVAASYLGEHIHALYMRDFVTKLSIWRAVGHSHLPALATLVALQRFVDFTSYR